MILMNTSSARDSLVEDDRIIDLASTSRRLLRDFLRIPSVSGNEGAFTTHVERIARAAGFETDLWETDERDLSRFLPALPRHIPFKSRPTLVVKLPGRG